MPLPPPEHLIRFFPIAGSPVERLIGDTRAAIRRIMQRKDDRLLVVMGPCSACAYQPLPALLLVPLALLDLAGMTVGSWVRFWGNGRVGKKKPPGEARRFSEIRCACQFAYTFASPAAERCENQKYAKK
jgi:hypothetical protein